MHSSTTREEAIQLRNKGRTYAEIARLLGVSKSSLSLWLRELPVPLESTPEARRAYFLAHVQRKGAEANRLKKQLMWDSLLVEAKQAVAEFDLDNRQLHMSMLAMLYWAEGTKYDKGGIVFTNTDPRLAVLFITLLRKTFSIDEPRIRVRLHLHSYHDRNEALGFWSMLLEVPRSQFQSTYIKKRSVSKKFRQNFMGICFIKYGDSKTRRKVLSYAYAIQKRFAPVAQLD